MIQSNFPSISSGLVSTKSLHKSVDTAKHRFITIAPYEDKIVTLVQILTSRKDHHVLVFCNNADSCRAVEHSLQEVGSVCKSKFLPLSREYIYIRVCVVIFCAFAFSKRVCIQSPKFVSILPLLQELEQNVFHYHGAMPAEARIASLEKFLEEESGVLVCTDLAARGLDFDKKVYWRCRLRLSKPRELKHLPLSKPVQVKTVIQFDFATNPIDYIHRTGRTARANTTGTIISFITKRDRELASQIQEAIEKGFPIDDVSASKNQSTATPRGQCTGCSTGLHSSRFEVFILLPCHEKLIINCVHQIATGGQRTRQQIESSKGSNKRSSGRSRMTMQSAGREGSRSPKSTGATKSSRTSRRTEPPRTQRQRSTKR